MTVAAQRVGRWIAIAAVAAIALATLTPATTTPPLSGRWCIVCGELGGVDVTLNMLLFAPLGAGLAVAGVRWWRAISLSLLLSLVVETLQIRAIDGRDASIGDLLMNTLGGGLGALVGTRWRGWLLPSPAAARSLQALASAGWVTALAASAWLLQPSLPIVPLWGQLTPTKAEMEAYHGRVVSLLVNGKRIISEPLVVDTAFYRPFQTGDARIEALVTSPGRRSRRVGGIARIAGSDVEALLLGQLRLDFVVRIRLRSADFRLRTPAIAVPDAFPAPVPGVPSIAMIDTMRIAAGMADHQVFGRVESRQGARAWGVPLTPSLGWSLIVPFSAPIQVGYRWISAIWVGLLFLPAAFWGAAAATRGQAPSGRRTAAMVGLAAVIGLVFIPLLFGLPVAHWSEWCGVLGGAAVGVGAARVLGATRKSEKFA